MYGRTSSAQPCERLTAYGNANNGADQGDNFRRPVTLYHQVPTSFASSGCPLVITAHSTPNNCRMSGTVAAAAEAAETVTATGMSSPVVFLTLVLASLTLYYTYWRIKNARLIALAEKLPGPRGLPLLGNALMLLGSAHDVFRKAYELRNTYGSRIGRLWVGTRLVVLLADPNDIEVILGSQVHLDKAPEYRFFKPWLGNGLLISSGQHWRSHRKLIAPTFHLNVLKSFMALFNRNARDACAKMIKHKKDQFDCHDYMSACTVETLLETAMGVNKKTQNHSGFEYAKAVMDMCNMMHFRQLRPWLYSDFLYSFTSYKGIEKKLLTIIHDLTKKVIKQKKEEWATGVKRNLAAEFELDKFEEDNTLSKKSSEEAASAHSFGQAAGLKDDLDVDDNDIGEKKRVAFLDLMIESAQNGVVMNDNDIREEVDTIMFEGHDTTAAGSSFFLSLMAAHPDIQERVYQEMNEIFGDTDRPVTFQDTLEMKYLERCIMETLRLYPPVPFIARQIKEDVKLPGTGYTLPAGATVAIITFQTHRDETVYPNPEMFDPDNFLPERSADRHYYSFIPFSAGPRSCVGRKYAMLKLKVILSTIIRAFKIKSNLGETDFKLQADIILKREEGFMISLEPRPNRSGLIVAV